MRTTCCSFSTKSSAAWALPGQNWCCEHFDVLPDLLAFGKKAQVCGVMAGPRLDEVKDNVFRLPSRISSTWGGNFCDYVRSTHYLRIIEEEKLVANARSAGEILSGRIAGAGRETSRPHRGARTRPDAGLRSAQHANCATASGPAPMNWACWSSALRRTLHPPAARAGSARSER